MNPLEFFALALKACLFSTGGMGNAPSLHADLVATGRATDTQFAEALAIGQVAPGPNGLWVVSFGYFVDGLRGAFLCLLALALPPFLVLAVDRLYRRVKDHPAMEGFVRGLSLSVVGVFAVTLAAIFRGNGIDLQSVIVAALAFALVASRRVPVIAIIGLAAAAGILLV